MITAESHIPLIPRARAQGGWQKYPWASMEVGDSFFVPHVRIEWMSAQAVNRAKKTGVKFTCRSVVEGEIAGVRVWRVS